LLQNHSFGAPFRASIFSEFDRFVVENDNPAMEFLDADLEGQRVALVEAVHEFSHYLAKHTWRVGESMQSVPSEWVETQLGRYDKVVEQLNSMSTTVAEKYAALVREARRRLGVDVANTAG
jgi:hypothetical protein